MRDREDGVGRKKVAAILRRLSGPIAEGARTNEEPHRLTTLLFWFVLVLIGLAVDRVLGSLGPRPFWTTLWLVLACLLSAFVFMFIISRRLGHYYVSKCKDEFCLISMVEHLAESAELMGRLIHEVPHLVLFDGKVILRNVITATQLAGNEKSLPAGAEIWVITANLKEELPGELFHEVAEHNLKRGVQYKYFVPERSTLDGQLQIIAGSYRAYQALIEIILVPEHFFLLFPELDLAIYDNPASGHSYAYIQLPADGSPEHVFSRVTDIGYINAIRRRLNEYIPKRDAGGQITTSPGH